MLEIDKSQSSGKRPPVRAIYGLKSITGTRVGLAWKQQESTVRPGECGTLVEVYYDTPAARTQVKPGGEKGGCIIARDIAVIYESRSLNHGTPLA